MYYICAEIETSNYMEKADSTIAQMRKGVLEMCVMSVIEGQEAYASDILEQLKMAHLIVVEGTLYPILTRLKNEGFLSYRWEESLSGPPRKYFCLTPEGIEFLKELKNGWADLVSAINVIVSTNKNDSEILK
jgi:PadR family transcriptional regulator, regulatory protein PadR